VVLELQLLVFCLVEKHVAGMSKYFICADGSVSIQFHYFLFKNRLRCILILLFTLFYQFIVRCKSLKCLPYSVDGMPMCPAITESLDSGLSL
jgi:hypothetical protein